MKKFECLPYVTLDALVAAVGISSDNAITVAVDLQPASYNLAMLLSHPAMATHTGSLLGTEGSSRIAISQRWANPQIQPVWHSDS